jgi:hypothetical protein
VIAAPFQEIATSASAPIGSKEVTSLQADETQDHYHAKNVLVANENELVNIQVGKAKQSVLQHSLVIDNGQKLFGQLLSRKGP